MAKQVKTKFVLTVPIVDLAPEGAKPLKAKVVLANLSIGLTGNEPDDQSGEVTQPRLTLGKAKVQAV
jgi:hypothetical protein